MTKIPLISFCILTCLAMDVHGQQTYSGFSAQDCESNEQNFLYTCNGEKPSCQAFLIFKSTPPYNSVQTISNLTSSRPEELARVNNFAESEVIPTDKEVIIPVNCSCAGQFYQKNTSKILHSQVETYEIVANDIFQGLSTCKSLIIENKYDEFDLKAGLKLKVPLRCACPTRNQTENGTKFLLTYPLNGGDRIPDLSQRFNVSARSILYANELSEDDLLTVIFSSTPILIPLPTEPSSSLTIIHKSNDNDTPTIPPLLDSDPRRPKSKSKRELHTVIAITSGCSLLILVLALSAFFLVYKKRSKGLKLLPRASTKRMSPEDLRVEIASFEKDNLHVYGIEEIKKATESFSSEKQIKGSVFKGVFSNGKKESTTLAVKRTGKDVSNEVNILKKLNHFNLIKLEGVCKYHDRFYLVFEYMENGSLREWLCGNCSEKDRTWTKRIQIALDIAHGLNYLHSFTKPGYVHKNIKSSNILLNRNMRAKIANFRLAGPAMDETTTTTSTEHSETTTMRSSQVVGTRGYVDPEYLATGVATPKVDVFAFGVVILELMTRKNAMAVQNGRQVLLSAKIVEIMEGDDPEADLDLFIDPSLKEDHDRYKELAMRVAKLSVACLKREPEGRPTMGEVISILSKIQADLQTTEL